MRVEFKVFESSFQSWEALFAEAAEFASHIDGLISISHSHAGPGLGGMGVVTVWYWTEAEKRQVNPVVDRLLLD